MLSSHKFLDALTNAPGADGTLLVPSDLDRTWLSQLVVDLAGAEKFAFDGVPFEPDGDRLDHWRFPALTDAELEMWSHGLVPLPAPVCWFELTINQHRAGLLVRQRGNAWYVTRLDRTPAIDGTTGFEYLVDGLERTLVVAPTTCQPGTGAKLTVGFIGYAPQFYQRVKAQPSYAEQRRLHGRIVSEDYLANAATDAYLAIYLVLMLHSRTTEIQREVAPLKLNQKRAGQGRAPLSDHLVVRIVPWRYVERTAAQDGTHASPRLHWRRSHARCYDRATPHSVWASTYVYKGRPGWWVQVIARQLVGKRELGSVSHEYFVGSSKPRLDDGPVAAAERLLESQDVPT